MKNKIEYYKFFASDGNQHPVLLDITQIASVEDHGSYLQIRLKNSNAYYNTCLLAERDRMIQDLFPQLKGEWEKIYG